MAENIEKILVIDDVGENLKLLEKRLSGDGFTVATADNGKEGLAKLKGADFDMVLLDIAMPGMDGIAVLKEIRQDESLNQVLVIMATAEEDMNTALRCLRMGAQGYMTKPFDLDQIKQQIQNCQSAA